MQETTWKKQRILKNDIRIGLKEMGVGWGLDSSGSGKVPVVGCCEHGNEPLECINDG
jgi:hypothetical protein